MATKNEPVRTLFGRNNGERHSDAQILYDSIRETICNNMIKSIKIPIYLILAS